MTKYKRNIKAVFFRFKKYLCKAFSNFDFNSTIKKKYSGICNCLEIRSEKGFR